MREYRSICFKQTESNSSTQTTRIHKKGITMEAEQINALHNLLEDLKQRTIDLRGYL